ncbi:MFS transporter [Tardiphaga sp.]|uniref:MFS transporter n=1 Tax=Tardiphaga sp. TaxID=1926292 RepID=UPI0037DA725E
MPRYVDVFDNRPRITAAMLGLGAFLTQFDVTSVIMAMPAIGRDLGLGVAGLTWVVDSYSLAFTVTLLVAGALADRFGRRRALLLGNATFLLASLACGIARNGPELWAARAVQGIGAAFVITGAIASIAAIFPSPAARVRAFGVVGVMSGISMALGPTLGAVISAYLGWRWIFVANLPFCILIAVVIPHLVADAREDRGRPIHWPGVALLAIALGVAIEAFLLTHESLLYLIAGLAISASLFIVFIGLQRRQPTPMFDLALFRSRPMVAAAILLIAVSIGYWALLVYLPLFFGVALGWTGENAGMAMLILTLPMLIIPPIAARLGASVGWRILFGAALAAMTIGGTLLAVAALAEDAGIIMTATVIGMLAMGSGAAVAHPQLSGVVVVLVPADHRNGIGDRRGGAAGRLCDRRCIAGRGDACWFRAGVPGRCAGVSTWLRGLHAAAATGLTRSPDETKCSPGFSASRNGWSPGFAPLHPGTATVCDQYFSGTYISGGTGLRK